MFGTFKEQLVVLEELQRFINILHMGSLIFPIDQKIIK